MIHSPPFRERLAAFGWDYLVILGYIILMTAASALLFLLLSGLREAIFRSPLLSDAFAFAALVLPVNLYFTFTESGAHQASWGKRRRGLRVVTTAGLPLTFSRALLRNIVKFLPWQVAHTGIFQMQVNPQLCTVCIAAAWLLVGLYFLSILVTKDRWSVYDFIAGTKVVFR